MSLSSSPFNSLASFAAVNAVALCFTPFANAAAIPEFTIAAFGREADPEAADIFEERSPQSSSSDIPPTSFSSISQTSFSSDSVSVPDDDPSSSSAAPDPPSSSSSAPKGMSSSSAAPVPSASSNSGVASSSSQAPAPAATTTSSSPSNNNNNDNNGGGGTPNAGGRASPGIGLFIFSLLLVAGLSSAM